VLAGSPEGRAWHADVLPEGCVPNPLKILLVEDSENDAALLALELRRHGFAPDVTRVERADDLRRALDAGGWDIVISDHSLPGFSGTEALSIVRTLAPDLPFIVVSGSLGEEHAVEAMRAGARDFVVKTRLHRVAPVVTRELRESAQRAEQRRISAALAESQNLLRHAQKLEAIGRLAGGIAHDFNNLLTAIIGYADLVLKALPEDDPRRTDVLEIRSAGSRAADLTRQLLVFSRQQVLDAAVLDLNDVVQESVRLLQRVIGEDVAVGTNCASDLWPVKADRTQMIQILMNLAVNARDAMPHGGSLTIATRNVTIDRPGLSQHPQAIGEYVVLSVCDTGEGIPEDVLPKIFEPFFTTKEPAKGTGLGLSMVYGIVQQTHGVIFVDSDVGTGTTFTIFLPRTEEEEASRPVPSAPIESGHQTILLVEDEASLRDLASRVLRQGGYHVMAVASADEALRAAEERAGAIDLLLTDVVMPGMNGVALASELRRAHPDLSVLFMSGYTGEAAGVYQRVEPSDVLPKPFSASQLIRRVQDALHRPGTRRS
jgi:signal transduction histidine kinase